MKIGVGTLILRDLLFYEPVDIPGNKKHQKINEIFIRITAILYATFHVYTAGFGAFPNMIQRSIHVSFALVLVYLLFSIRTKKESQKIMIVDYLAVLLAILSVIWIYISYDFYMSIFIDIRMFDLILGLFVIIIVLEGSRRVMGIAIPLLSLISILYAIFGNYFPGNFRHQGTSLAHLIENLYTTTGGLWGQITSATATTVAIFIVFGAFLLRTGGADTFSNFALWVSGSSMGGPAKVSTISSGLFGMISGSSVANVAITGAISIPMMKKRGYKSEFAAAVEAVASSGGQLLPPIMGTAAFIMAELIAVPYLSIAASAAIPALLFYLAFYFAVHFYSTKNNYKGLEKNEIPGAKKVFEPFGLLQVVLPMVLLLYLLTQGFSTARSGFWATTLLVVIYLIREIITNRKNFGKSLLNILRSLEDAGYGLIIIALLAASAQVIVNVLGQTGLGVVFSQMVMALSDKSLFFSLLLAMVLCIILGMGVPTTAAYLIAAAVIGPALVNLGLEAISVHLFILYFAVLSGITPPICAAIFVSASMANANWVKSAILACRIGFVIFLLPYIFIYSPELLLLNIENVWIVILSIITATIGCIFIASGMSGYLLRENYWWECMLLTISGMVMIVPGFYSDLVGIVIGGGVLINQKWIRKSIPEKMGNYVEKDI